MAPTGRVWQKGSALIEKIKDYYFGVKKEEQPLISERTALCCAILFTIIYIAPFYLSKTLRSTPLNSRDAPSVIRARIRAVIISCSASTAVAVYVLIRYGHAELHDVLRLFAVWPVDPLDVVKVLALVCVLFTGPLYESVIIDGDWREWSFRSAKETLWDSLPGFRNYVVAPLSEELVFRSLVISLYLLARVSPLRIVFVTPLIFGVAHIHHLVEFIQSRTPPGQTLPSIKFMAIGIIRSLFQFCYTSLFGFFAAFVYLRTGNVVASVVAHTFCNFMGLPRVWGRVGQPEASGLSGVTPDVAQGKRIDTISPTKLGQVRVSDGKWISAAPGHGITMSSTVFTALYYVLLIVGAFGFYKLLWTWTESRNALAKF